MTMNITSHDVNITGNERQYGPCIWIDDTIVTIVMPVSQSLLHVHPIWVQNLQVENLIALPLFSPLHSTILTYPLNSPHL